MKFIFSIALLFLLGGPIAKVEAAEESYKRVEDIVYGRKFGTALTMDLFQPKNSNGYAVAFMVSGGFFSSHEAINPAFFKPFLDRGYSVFAVVHGSQPKFTIPEITSDIHRAIRFIRAHAAEYGVNPGKLGITGASAGGHLSLTMGTQGGKGASDAKDAIDREDSSVQAVACFFPPTDFLNWGGEGVDAVGVGPLAQFKPAFGPRSDTPAERKVYGREISPLNFLTANLPPTLIIHGDADRLVPIQQARIFVARAKELKAPAPVELIERPGKDHGWKELPEDLNIFADWFDKYLRGMGK